MAGSEKMDKQPRLKADKMSRSKLPLAVLFSLEVKKRKQKQGGKAMSKLCLTIGWVTIILIIGCGRSGEKVKVPELGLSMNLPSGWRVDKENPRMFFATKNPDKNYGMVADYPLEIRTLEGELIKSQPTLEEYVDNKLDQVKRMETMTKGLGKILEEMIPGEQEIEEQIPQISIISKTHRTISGLEAIEIVTEAEYTIIEVNIRKGERVIQVSFRTPRDDFPELESSFRNALNSIEIQ
jgi:hypothetical protein